MDVTHEGWPVVTSGAGDLLRRSHDLLVQQADRADPLSAALLAMVEGAVELTEVDNDRDVDLVVRRLQEAASCIRAAACVVRFAIVATRDRRLDGRPDSPDEPSVGRRST